MDSSARGTPGIRSFSRQGFRNPEQTPPSESFPIRLVRLQSGHSTTSPFNICDERASNRPQTGVSGALTGRSMIKKIPETWRMGEEKEKEKVGDCEESMIKIQALMKRCKKLNREVARVEKKANKTGNIYKKELRSIRRGYRKQKSEVKDYWQNNEDFIETRAKMYQELSEFKDRMSIEREETARKKRAEELVKNIEPSGEYEFNDEDDDCTWDGVTKTILKVPNLAFHKMKTLTRAAMIESRNQSSPKIVPTAGGAKTERGGGSPVPVPPAGAMTDRASTASPRKRIGNAERSNEKRAGNEERFNEKRVGTPAVAAERSNEENAAEVKRRIKVKRIESAEVGAEKGEGGTKGMEKLIGVMKAKKKIMEKMKMSRENQRKIEEEKVKDVVNIYSLKIKSKSTEKMGRVDEDPKAKMKEDYLKKQQERLGYTFEGGFMNKLMAKHQKSVGAIIKRLSSERSLKL